MKRLVLLLLLTAFGLSACAPPGTYRRIRDGIREMAIREIGPADTYEVRTSRDNADRLMKGRVSRVEVHGINVRPAPGYILDEVFISARNVRVNRRKRTVEGAEETAAKAYITDRSLATMVTAEDTVKDPQVTITPQEVRIAGSYAAFGAIPMDILATGKVRITGAAAVEFASDRVTAAGIPVPLSINKSFDLSTLYPWLVLTGVSTEQGRVVLLGTIDWSKIRNGESPAD